MVLSKRIRIFDCVEDTLVRKKKIKTWSFILFFAHFFVSL